MRLLGIFVFTIFFIIGCTTPQELVVKTESVKQLNISIPAIKELNLHKIKWKVIEYNNKPYISLSTSEYEKLSYNMLELQRYIKEQHIIINTIKKDLTNAAESQDTLHQESK